MATLAYAVVVVVHVAVASFGVDYGEGKKMVMAVLSWIIGLTLAIFGFLLANLIVLHVYLFVTEQTTYQFLQRKKKEE